MKNTLITELAETVWTMSHESPPWNNNSHSELLSHIQESFLDEENSFLPLISTHAAVECGILSQKYPQTEWISIGVTISDMHTTRESIKEEDFKIFIERMEKFI